MLFTCHHSYHTGFVDISKGPQFTRSQDCFHVSLSAGRTAQTDLLVETWGYKHVEVIKVAREIFSSMAVISTSGLISNLIISRSTQELKFCKFNKLHDWR